MKSRFSFLDKEIQYELEEANNLFNPDKKQCDSEYLIKY